MSIVPKKNKFPQQEEYDTSSEIDPIRKGIMTLCLLVVLCMCFPMFFSGMAFLIKEMIKENWYDVKYALFIVLFGFLGVFFSIFLLMYWYWPNNKLMKKFLKKINSPASDKKAEKVDEDGLTAKERKALNIYMYGFVFFVSVCVMAIDFKDGLVFLGILLIIRPYLIEVYISDYKNNKK